MIPSVRASLDHNVPFLFIETPLLDVREHPAREF